MSDTTYAAGSPTADTQSAPRTATPVIHRIWPVAVIAFGLGPQRGLDVFVRIRACQNNRDGNLENCREPRRNPESS